MTAAFIVHTDDTPFVMRLALHLNDAGIITRIGDPHAKTQHILQAETFNALKQANFVVACLTQASLENEWMRRQLQTAREQSKIILRVDAEKKLAIPDNLGWLRDRETFDFTQGYDAGVGALILKMASYRTDRSFTHPAWDTVRNPYVGLQHFQQWDAPVLAGRDEDIRRGLQHLREKDFLAIVAASGSGKTSFVQAGLIPNIRQGAIDGSDSWAISIVRPDTRPMLALWDSLTGIQQGETDKPTRYPQSAVDMLETVDAMLEGRQWLLVIDPLEQLFTHSGETERDQFLDMLRVLASASTNTKIIVTLRSEFFNNLKEYPDLARLFDNEHLMALMPLAEEYIADVITVPAQSLGLRFDAGLVEQIRSDYAKHDMPALQYALYQLFVQRDDDRLTQSAYEAMGGMHAIDMIAEQAYTALDDDKQAGIQQFFLSQTNITQGTIATYQRTVPDDLQSTITAWLSPRNQLLSASPNTQPPLVKMTHPALARQWQRLATWIEENKQSLTYQAELRREQQNWYANNIDPAYLLHGGALKRAEAWLVENRESSLAPFIQASRREDDERTTSQQRTRRQLDWMRTLRRAVIAVFLLVVLLALAGMISMLVR